ncbi:MAG: sodium-translocating pyrophosphatase [SAR202 cluster bacterium]|nr:sodium-translocating pyrophosphatase [Chloroflexota bacterium]MQG50907.1 sodium-translocating pyrophosphatase [SAR202 cluster bacterium]|tara:strand:+ start:6255 stop:8312 length:2058 start_codon:yes stop_codon:yes gene_type:complete
MSLLPLLVLGAGALALLFAAYLAFKVNSEDAGNERVQEIGAAIHEGAMAFLNREYKLLAVFVIIITGILAVFIDYDVLSKIDGDNSGLPSTAISYIAGAIGSALAGFIGMVIAVKSNMRTATAATKGLNPGLRVAFNSGSVMGMTVVGIGITGVTLLYMIFKDAQIISGFGFGASTIALFARVGGGIYTKAADVGADLVGKVEQGIPEDDPRNPAVIADNVGDNVGDVAGMGADLFESYVGSIIAAIALATTSAIFATQTSEYDGPKFILPLLIASIGIVASIIGTFLVRTGENASMNKLLWALRTGIFTAGGLVILGTVAAVSYLDFELTADQSKWNFVWVVVVGIIVGQIIGTATEYYTAYEYSPTKKLSEQAVTGPATVIIGGMGLGMISTAIPTISIVAGILISYELASIYGIALAAVGMLSTLGITLATDAYGPVADNAGGIAEQAHLPEETRERTDALDALGNTTAATGKGFAIGSAVLTSLALMVAYAQLVKLSTLDLLEPIVLVGLLIGSVLPYVFSSMTMQAVGRAANSMIQEVRRQFREIPGIMEGTGKPDYAKAVDISTSGSLREMVLPGLLAVIAPILVGSLMGKAALGGMLLGSISSGFLLAVTMANAGGAWDNAKKYVELGNHGGKGSEAHEAAVVGDTVGDPFKDTSGPSLNILIKLMAMVSLVFGQLFI